MTKPKPAKPATPEMPSPAPPQGSEPQPQGADNTYHNESPGDANSEVPPADAEPMETDKSETARGAA